MNHAVAQTGVLAEQIAQGLVIAAVVGDLDHVIGQLDSRGLHELGDAILLARRTRRIVIQNIIFALGVKALVLILGALGIVGLNAAVFADVGVAVIAILNSMRNLKQ